ncbi:hypothetical protein GCM10022251_56010 [Phytohabitans flavus]|uniref:Uncharacterized protein n=1 Tax=Phytohabitans flavus TaxID=1076124 RepID=A0A6F8XQK0_9ACTN|nr:hypothetical protein [Phytohabitans flavus]BCB76021.1 hypothetical protein Pflav_024310 [Phytohabitans flavus]
MSDHGWGGEWPDDLDPDSGGDLGPDAPDLGSDLSSGFGPDFGEAETADLSHLDPLSDGPDDPSGDFPDLPDSTSDAPLDPAGDSTMDMSGFDAADGSLDAGDGSLDASDGSLDAADGDAGGDLTPDGAAELTTVGADPDLDGHTDTFAEQAFPEPLDLDAPEPVDGFPWTDPTTLGAAPLPDPEAGFQGAPEANELAAYAGEDVPAGADPWTALSASEDPATSSLARWWSPDA